MRTELGFFFVCKDKIVSIVDDVRPQKELCHYILAINKVYFIKAPPLNFWQCGTEQSIICLSFLKRVILGDSSFGFQNESKSSMVFIILKMKKYSDQCLPD